MNTVFRLQAPFSPAGEQPAAIDALTRGLAGGQRFQVLEGVTGSGKTFTAANVIARLGRPALVISHNKTLAAQVYGELKGYFPDHAVEYFVSYYDYYQPEAYIPQTDTYIEKDASINKEIERLRLSATNSLLSRPDVVVVASVSCIYGLGSPEDYEGMLVRLERGQELDRDSLLRRLVDIQYGRNDVETEPGSFRVRGDTVDIFPSYSRKGLRVIYSGDRVDVLRQIDPLTGNPEGEQEQALISPAKHFVMPSEKLEPAIQRILAEMKERVAWFESQGKLIEAQRIQQRTLYDVEMMREIGYCSGIENYSRHLSGRAAGEPPATLLSYFRGDFLTLIDESHVTIPQLRAMFNGDQARKQTLVEHGFRLPSAKDNRPLNFDEFLSTVHQVLFTTATPGPFERQMAPVAVQQYIRPTGLVDPLVEIRPLEHQVDDVMEEIRAHAERHERVLVTTLTKRSAEDLAAYLRQSGLRVEHLHSDVSTLDRVEILRRLRNADFDCLVGVNLLREGLDLPEVALVAILDADKEGFLRSETALVQVAGRAARNVNGKVILYGDVVTGAMRNLLALTSERRRRQDAYNREHGITPRTVERALQATMQAADSTREIERNVVRESGVDYDVHQAMEDIEREMLEAAESLEFERAADLRDQLQELKRGVGADPSPSVPPAPGSRAPKKGRGGRRQGR